MATLVCIIKSYTECVGTFNDQSYNSWQNRIETDIFFKYGEFEDTECIHGFKYIFVQGNNR